MNERDMQIIIRRQKHTEAILRYTQDCGGKDVFLSDPMLMDACVFNLMQIGELAKQQLSDTAKEKFDKIPWKLLYGMRNRIVHGYEGVNLNIVWETVRNDIPYLDNDLREIIASERT